MDLIQRAKALQQAKADHATTLTSSSDFELDSLDSKSLYMRMCLLCLSLWDYLKGTSYVRFSTLFKARGLCHRSRAQLRASMDSPEQLQQLRTQLHSLLETVDYILEQDTSHE